MNIIIFEDLNTMNLEPFSINHASFELKCGIYSNLNRITNIFGESPNYYLIVRDQIKDLIQEKFPRYTVNPTLIPEGIYLNGAAIWNKEYIQKISSGYAFSSSGNLVAFNSNNKIDFKDFCDFIQKTSHVTSDIDMYYISYLWDCINIIKETLIHDAQDFSASKSTQIEEGCILDDKDGPIILGNNVTIQSGSIIKGPVFIDSGSTINIGAKLNKNIIVGPECKIGGEVTNTIFQGYSNKQHEGFLGHSYVGEWVNLGANTNNSNLKNNYGTIKFQFSDKTIDSKKIFLGAMIGDFTRTGISTMINTGSNFGLGANVFGGGFQNKYIESFSWGKDDITDFNKFIETIKIIKSRRDKELSESELLFLKECYKSFIK